MEQTKNIENLNSCKIAINAKGQFSGEIKVYATTIEDAMAQALNKAKELEIIIKDKNKI